MQRFDLNGIWNLKGGEYDCNGTIPGSVYSFLLDNKLINDPFYRDNELKCVGIMDNEFEFSRKFDYTLDNNTVLLCCDGLDTLCDIYVNGTHIAYTDNMHRSYEFDVTSVLKNGENEIRAVFYSPNIGFTETLSENNDKILFSCKGTTLVWGMQELHMSIEVEQRICKPVNYIRKIMMINQMAGNIYDTGI